MGGIAASDIFGPAGSMTRSGMGGVKSGWISVPGWIPVPRNWPQPLDNSAFAQTKLDADELGSVKK